MARLGFTLVLLVAVVWRAHGQGDFSLEDAFDDIPTQKPKPAPKPPKVPTHNSDDFSLDDFFDDITTKKPKPAPKPPKVPTRNTDDIDLSDSIDATKPPKVVPKRPTKKPDVFITTKKPRASTVKPRKQPGPHDFSLEDALDPKNDPNKGGSTIRDKDKPKGGGNKDFSDSDLDDIMNGGYKPDKGRGRDKGDGRHQEDDRDQGQGNLAETGTIAGIASALVMALVGAVSSYISYQQKKFCFSIQQGLNAEYVKGENMEAVMVEEPQVKYSALEHQSAAPPTEDPSKV
ncbi:CD99 antigen-like protein 2 isoform X1 [Ranitomeya variabilis]|uniref:CD99 antigen-like protein 2 isoform X1 n=1 Tax=Ranitomeya variabilis TaxID=490064 RepID=UPI004055A6ED